MLLSASHEEIKGEKTSFNLIKNVYFKWVEEAEAANVDKIIALYQDDAILLPTLCPKIYTSNQMRIYYFKRFLSLNDLKIETKELITKEYGDIAMNTGLYDISYTLEEKKAILKSRFDFWYKKIDGKWMIIYHQSSALPKDGKLDECTK